MDQGHTHSVIAHDKCTSHAIRFCSATSIIRMTRILGYLVRWLVARNIGWD
uniref:Uncharacterized protein n=1 Tax=Arundo donax TaxID=35708 RepID=A0A0A9BB94_ARUDO